MKKSALLVIIAIILLGCRKENEDLTTGIVTGDISLELISIGEISFNLAEANDISFTIMRRPLDSSQSLGSSFGYSYEGVSADTLDIIVQGTHIEFISGLYTRWANPLNEGDIISEHNTWLKGSAAMNSFGFRSSFTGQDQYLGIKLIKGKKSHYGWIKVYCSRYKDTLKVIEYGYNSTPGREIKAGQINN